MEILNYAVLVAVVGAVVVLGYGYVSSLKRLSRRRKELDVEAANSIRPVGVDPGFFVSWRETMSRRGQSQPRRFWITIGALLGASWVGSIVLAFFPTASAVFQFGGWVLFFLPIVLGRRHDRRQRLIR